MDEPFVDTGELKVLTPEATELALDATNSIGNTRDEMVLRLRVRRSKSVLAGFHSYDIRKKMNMTRVGPRRR